MANNGNHPDTKTFKKHIREGKYIRHYPTDNNVDRLLKAYMNELIEFYITERVWHGWNDRMRRRFNNIHIRLNQIRQKHWYFRKLKI